MKNISIHSLIGLTVLCMSSCTDDYTDWATPQANEQEAAITLPDFSASKVDDINLSNQGAASNCSLYLMPHFPKDIPWAMYG